MNSHIRKNCTKHFAPNILKVYVNTLRETPADKPEDSDAASFNRKISFFIMLLFFGPSTYITSFLFLEKSKCIEGKNLYKSTKNMPQEV